MKPSRSRDKPVHQSKAPQNDLDQSADAGPGVALTPEERARLLAGLEAAERSIEEEGTINAEELLEQRAEYWAGLTRNARESGRNAALN